MVNFNLDSNWIIFSFEKPNYFDIKDMQRNGYEVHQLSNSFVFWYWFRGWGFLHLFLSLQVKIHLCWFYVVSHLTTLVFVFQLLSFFPS